MHTYSACPICGHSKFETEFSAKDYTVSQEVFTISSCINCSFLITNPRPEDKDLGKYYKSDAYISHSDTSKGLINRVYKLVRSYTLRSKYRLVKPFLGDGILMDIGAGTGAFVRHCKSKGIKILGVEPDSDARMQAEKLYSINLLEESAIKSQLASTVDVVTMWHVLEHIPNLNERMDEINSILKPGGVLIAAVPNHESADAEHYAEFWGAYDVPRHLYHFDLKAIKSLGKNHGFRLIRVKNMPFDAFYVSLLSEKYKSGRMNWVKAIIIGLRTLFSSGVKGSSSKIYILEKGH